MKSSIGVALDQAAESSDRLPPAIRDAVMRSGSAAAVRWNEAEVLRVFQDGAISADDVRAAAGLDPVPAAVVDVDDLPAW